MSDSSDSRFIWNFAVAAMFVVFLIYVTVNGSLPAYISFLLYTPPSGSVTTPKAQSSGASSGNAPGTGPGAGGGALCQKWLGIFGLCPNAPAGTSPKAAPGGTSP